MKAKIIIQMDNAAFDDPGELPRILRDLARRLENDPQDAGSAPLYDFNGNKVGELKFMGGRR